MERHTNTLVGQVNIGTPVMESVTNHLVGTVEVNPMNIDCRCYVLNNKINTMLSSNVLLDTDVRDLWTIMGELGIRDQWKEMNAKIRAELEGISKHVEEATKILDANPPELKWRSYTAGMVLPATAVATAVPATVTTVPAFGYSTATLVPGHEQFVRYAPFVHEEKRWGLEKPKLVSMPWQQWNCEVNAQVANANVNELIPVKKQVVVRRLFGEWDAMMADVAEWHARGLNRFNVRLCMAPSAVQYVHGPTVQYSTVQTAPTTVEFVQGPSVQYTVKE